MVILHVLNVVLGVRRWVHLLVLLGIMGSLVVMWRLGGVMWGVMGIMGMLLKREAGQLMSSGFVHAAVGIGVLLSGRYLRLVFTGTAMHLWGNHVDLSGCNVTKGHFGAPLSQTPFPLRGTAVGPGEGGAGEGRAARWGGYSTYIRTRQRGAAWLWDCDGRGAARLRCCCCCDGRGAARLRCCCCGSGSCQQIRAVEGRDPVD